MSRPQPSQPDPDPDGFWPSCDDQQPGVSIRPLRHADLAALLAHLDRDRHDAMVAEPAATPPIVAMRVRASVGRPGASAQAEYQRRRAAERAAWWVTVPWRVAAVLAAGGAAGLLATALVPRRGGLAGVVAAAGLAWLLRFRPSTDTRAWRRGAAEERRTARLLTLLERRGWAVLHDLAIPGTQANLDHLVIGPGGVVVIDSKQYRGRLRLDHYGMLWHGRHLLVSTLRKVRWEADQADEVLGIAEVQVAAVVAVHGSSVPWGRVDTDGVTVIPARRVPDLLQALPPVLGPERVAWLADRARLRFRPAA
jgi:Nuclease-related domain